MIIAEGNFPAYMQENNTRSYLYKLEYSEEELQRIKKEDAATVNGTVQSIVVVVGFCLVEQEHLFSLLLGTSFKK